MSSVIGGLLGSAGGGEIGKAVVNLQLVTTQYQEQLNAAEAETKAKTSSMSSATKKLGAAQVAVYAAAAVAVAEFAKKSVEAAVANEEAQLKLANSIKNSVSVTSSAIPVFNAQALAVSNLTGASVDSVTAMQAFLVQMHLTQDQVTQLTPLIVDLATKQGIDLTTAAKAVGKAVNGTTGGLSRMGVVVDKTAAKTDAYGATLKALTVVQGFAADSANEHPWVLLQNTMHNLEITVGNELLPDLKALSVELEPLAKDLVPAIGEAFQIAATNAKPLIDTVGQLTQSIDTLKSQLGPLIPQQAASSSAFSVLGSVIKGSLLSPMETYNSFVLRHLGLTHSDTAAVTENSAAFEQQSLHTAESTRHILENSNALRANRTAQLQDAGGVVALSADLAQLATDQAAVNEARKKGTLDTVKGQAAERTYLQDKIAFRQALQDEAAQMLKNHDTMGQVVDTLTRLGRAAGLTRQNILDLTASLNGLPRNTNVAIHVNSTGGGRFVPGAI